MAATLTLVPQGGLCNRLRAILGAAYACRHSAISLRIKWTADAGCGAWFDELFEPLPTSFESLCLSVERATWSDAVGRKRNAYLPQLYRQWQGIKHHAPHATAQTLLHALTESTHHYLATGDALCTAYPTTQVGAWFRPLQELQEQIDRVSMQFSPHTYGLHIRRTDNAAAIAATPISRFVDAAEQLLATHDNARIYLATDDAHVHHHFIERFEGRILYQPFAVERHSLAGMQHAVVDLYALARTRHIVGSYYSSFSDTAAEIGQIPFTILTEQTRLDV